MKPTSKFRYPSFELTEESKESWAEEFKQLNSHLIKQYSMKLDDFWLDVILQNHIEKKKMNIQ